jgi:Mrp family chromosome partitioning ATPase
MAGITRPFGGASYWWTSSRARNASRRFAIMGIVGGLVFIASLIAFVLVPRQATRAAVRVSSTMEERPDSNRTVLLRNRAAAQIAAADSMLDAARRVAAPTPVAVVDTFPPEAIAQRQALAAEVATLNRLIERADNAPLPSSYRALATAPSLAADPVVRALLDSLADIERERDAFGTVGGVDPVYVALTSRATAVGRSIQSIAEAKRANARQQLMLLRPAAPPPPARPQVDTAKYLAERALNAKVYADAVRALAQMRAVNQRIDQETERARDLANVGAPPLAMLAAALVLALTLGFGASLFLELKMPTIADAREAEQVTGVRVLSVIEPTEVPAERSRRQADIVAPPLIDVVSESYRRLYLHLAATEANVPIVTVAGDDAAIVATVAANIASAAAYEARSTLLVDVDPTTSTIASVFRIPSNPGLAGIVSGAADWPEAIVQVVVGRDRVLDVLPSGARRAGAPDPEAAQRIRGDFARMERRYDLIVIAAPTAYVQHRRASIIPAPDVVLCARVAHTKLARLKEEVETLRDMNLRIHGIVLWNDDLPVIEAHDEHGDPGRTTGSSSFNLAGVR